MGWVLVGSIFGVREEIFIDHWLSLGEGLYILHGGDGD